MKVNMKKILKFTLHVLFILLLTSCTAFFDASTYYSSRRRHRNISDEDIRLPEDEETTPLAPKDEEAIQKLFDDAEKNKDSIFSASNFDGWIFYMTDLAGDNVGTYKFSTGTWQTDGNGESHTQMGTTVGSGMKTLSNVKYYRYKSREARWKYVSYTNFVPLEGADEKMKKREERFLFFRFTATSKGPSIDSAMLCVDTYTKFCWYYAEPSWLDSILGNKVPKDWVDFESPVLPTNGEQEHTRSYGKFYYYDPVGYVEASGDVVIYEWAKADLRRNYFNPRQNYLETAERSPDKPGKSPYYIAGSGGAGGSSIPIPPPEIPRHAAGLLVQASYIYNVDFSSIEQTSRSKLSCANLYVEVSAEVPGVYRNLETPEVYKKISLDSLVPVEDFNTFLIQPSELKEATSFKLKTKLRFANKQFLISSLGSYVDISKPENGMLNFDFLPATPSESAAVIFRGIENNDAKTKVSCSLEENKKYPLNTPLQIELTYKMDGEYYSSLVERRNVDATVKLGYTLDFVDGEDGALSAPKPVPHGSGLLLQLDGVENKDLRSKLVWWGMQDYANLVIAVSTNYSDDNISIPKNQYKVGQFNTVTGKNISIKDLKKEKKLIVCTEVKFANNGGGEICAPKEYGALHFAYIPSKSGNPSKVVFKGMENENYKGTGYTLNINCDMERGTEIPENTPVTIKLTYKLNGSRFTNEDGEKEFSLYYTLDFKE